MQQEVKEKPCRPEITAYNGRINTNKPLFERIIMTDETKTETETPKRRGRAPAKICLSAKPGIGETYLARTKDTDGNEIITRISTTCDRDRQPRFDGELQGVQLCNYSNGGPNGELYFTAKLGRKGHFVYAIFLCSQHHEKCMGMEVKPDQIPSAIANLMNRLSNMDDVKKDNNGRIIITGPIDTLEYEWIETKFKSVNQGGIYTDEGHEFHGRQLYFLNDKGAFVPVTEKKTVKLTEEEKAENKAKRRAETEKRQAERKAEKAAEKAKKKAEREAEKSEKMKQKEAAAAAKKEEQDKEKAQKQEEFQARLKEKEEQEAKEMAERDAQEQKEEKPVSEAAKESGAVKKPAKKKQTFYTVQNGKVVTKRVVNKPEGYVDTREEAEALLAAE